MTSPEAKHRESPKPEGSQWPPRKHASVAEQRVYQDRAENLLYEWSQLPDYEKLDEDMALNLCYRIHKLQLDQHSEHTAHVTELERKLKDAEWERDEYKRLADEWCADYTSLKNKYEPMIAVPSAAISEEG